MPWIVLDVVLAVAALVLLAVVSLRLWRAVQSLGARVGDAGERLGAALATLEAEQATSSALQADSHTARPAARRAGP